MPYCNGKEPKLSDLNSKLIIKSLGNALTQRLKKETALRGKGPTVTNQIMEALTLLGDQKRGIKPHYRVYSHGLSGPFQRKHTKFQNGKRRKKFRNVEWLYDLHWYREIVPTCYKLSQMPLVAESEWEWIRNEERKKNKKKKHKGDDPYGAVKYDFQKLLVANAELRLMIFKKRVREYAQRNKKVKPKTAEKCNKDLDEYFFSVIEKYKHLKKGSKFLFVRLNPRTGNFDFCLHRKISGTK